MKNKEIWLVAVVFFVAGLLVGRVMTDCPGTGSAGVPVVHPTIADEPVDAVQRLEQATEQQPKNVNAWAQLAQALADTNQTMPAVEAYARALELQPNDADLLTGQGMMYRRLGWFDQAAGNFSRAAELDPDHLQSLYTLGELYRDDLGDIPAAIAAWEQFLQRQPSGSASDAIRQQLMQLRQGVDTRLPH